MENGTFEVALTQKLCPVCCKPVESESEILMNSRLTEKYAKAVKDMHMKPTGFAKQPCEDCDNPEAVFLIGVDPMKTEDQNNPYRTGQVYGIKKEAFTRIFNQPIPKGRVAFVEEKVFGIIGLE